MKLGRALSLVSAGCLFLGGGVWLGCGGDDSATDSGSPQPDGGEDGTAGDTSTPETSVDSSKPDSAIGLDCASYCTAIQKTCKDLGTAGNNAQYLDEGTCLKMCAAIGVGAANDTSGDTLGCRIHMVELVAKTAKNATTYCPQAGPYGFGGCGDLCGDFCARYVTQCGGAGYDGGAQCVPTCVGLPSDDGGTLGTGNGNFIECREYHLENAYAYDSGPDGSGQGHCLHSGASGGGVCQ